MNRRALFGFSYAHFTADLNSGAVPALLPLATVLFSLSYTQAALVILVSNVTSSVIQPLFGIWADRRAMPWLLPFALSLACIGTAAYGLVHAYLPFVALVSLMGVGVAAFHPVGASGAYFAAGDRRASGMSIFSVGGNVGYAFGPLLAGFATRFFGLGGTAWFLVPGAVALVVLRLIGPSQLASPPHRAEANKRPVPWLVLGLLVFVVVLRSVAQSGVLTFFPLYLSHLHRLPPSLSGTVLFFFLGMGALGTLVGGPLSDRFGRRFILVWSWIASTPLLYLLPRVGGIWQFVVLGVLGFTIVATFSTTVVLAQELLPGHQAMASSLTIGLAVGLGGVVILLLGQVADASGVQEALNLLWLFGVVAFAASLFMPNRVPEAVAAD